MGRRSARDVIPAVLAALTGAVGGLLVGRRVPRRTTGRHAPPSTAAAGPLSMDAVHTGVNPEALGAVAVEVWRLGRRIAQEAQPHPRVVDSHARLLRTIEDAGARIEDPIHERFIEGMNAEIIGAPTGVDASRDALVIGDVVRPTVYVHDICVVVPQILLKLADGDEGRDQGVANND